MALGAMQQIVAAGLNPTMATPLTTENIIPNDDQFLFVKNGGGGSITVTLTDPGFTPAGSSPTNPVITVPNNAVGTMIPLNLALVNSSGVIVVTFSATASITAALLRM